MEGRRVLLSMGTPAELPWISHGEETELESSSQGSQTLLQPLLPLEELQVTPYRDMGPDLFMDHPMARCFSPAPGYVVPITCYRTGKGLA